MFEVEQQAGIRMVTSSRRLGGPDFLSFEKT